MIDARRPRGLGIKPKLLLLLLGLNLAAAIAFGVLIYTVERKEITRSLDERLRTAAVAVGELSPPSYIMRVTGPRSIAPSEYDAINASLTRLAEQAAFTHLYTFIQVGDHIRVTASSMRPEDRGTARHARFYSTFDNAPVLRAAFLDRTARFDEFRTRTGRYRTIYLPRRDTSGRTYVATAAADLIHRNAALTRSLWEAVGIALVTFTIAMIAGSIVIGRIVEPLTRLTGVTRKLEGRSFEQAAEEIGAMQRISRMRHDEVGSLAEAMSGMILRLQRHIAELQQATVARERLEGELAAARDIQMGMLPSVFPPFPQRTELDLHAILEPAKEIGGDLYDYFLIGANRLFFVVGDVSGKGVPAALFMAMTATLFRAYALASPGDPAGAIVGRVNAELSRDNAGEMFVTAIVGILDLTTGTLEYADAGHEAPFVLRADGLVDRVPKLPGIALGVIEEARYATGHLVLNPGDAVIAFTDGITEAMDAGDTPFGLDRLRAMLAALPPREPVASIARKLIGDVHGFAGEMPQSDDIAVVVLRYLG